MAYNYYAVKIGRITGIFNNWNECKKQIANYQNPKFKGFINKDDAINYLAEDNLPKYNNSINNMSSCIAYVDGSFNPKTNIYGYGVVFIYNNNIEEYHGHNNLPGYVNMRQVAGEIKASMIAVDKAIQKNIKHITIYYDYEGIRSWAIKKWKTNKIETKEYADFMQEKMEYIKIDFIHTKAHTGIEYNEKADKLAKNAVGII